MTDLKISALPDGGDLAGGDEIAVVRGGTDYRVTPIGVPVLVYRKTVTGADKASIDTGVDVPDAGSNDWANGDLLEAFITCRTDDAAAVANIKVNVNNDTGSNYDDQFIDSTNAVVAGAPELGGTAWTIPVHGSGGAASYPAILSIVVPNFAGTLFYKSGHYFRYLPDTSGANSRETMAGLGWRSTAPITRFAIAALAGAKFKVGTQLLIYKRLAS